MVKRSVSKKKQNKTKQRMTELLTILHEEKLIGVSTSDPADL